MAGLNVFDPRTVFLAKHAQHVVLVHFPIGLFISAVVFDWAASWSERRGLREAAYYNLLFAAISTIPVMLTGVLAWQFALEGQKLKGALLLHLALGWTTTILIWAIWWIHFRARKLNLALPAYRVALESVAVMVVGLTGHLGGFLTGVNV